MYPHRIRLRGPWELEARATEGDAPEVRRVMLPTGWGEIGVGHPFGQLRLRRRFGLPRQLDEWERVWLVCDGFGGRALWVLNGHEFQPMEVVRGAVEADITYQLAQRNELTIDLLDGQPDGPAWQEVALEIRCRAYLRGVRAVATRTEAGWQIQVRGAVVRDQPGDSLEVYALVNGKNQDYQQVQTDEPVSAVQFMLPWEAKQDEKELTVRVDLVNVSTIWHTAECVVKLEG